MAYLVREQERTNAILFGRCLPESESPTTCSPDHPVTTPLQRHSRADVRQQKSDSMSSNIGGHWDHAMDFLCQKLHEGCLDKFWRCLPPHVILCFASTTNMQIMFCSVLNLDWIQMICIAQEANVQDTQWGRQKCYPKKQDKRRPVQDNELSEYLIFLVPEFAQNFSYIFPEYYYIWCSSLFQ